MKPRDGIFLVGFMGAGKTTAGRALARLLDSLRDRPRIVVACGGGTYAQAESRALIDSMGRTVWVRIPLEMSLARCAAGVTERPLFKDAAQAEALYLARLPSYRAAVLHVDAEGLTPEEIAERIARSME